MNRGNGFVELLDRLRRDPQEVARAAAARGERVVGYVGNDIPVALVLAAGALPVRLRATEDTASPTADRYVEGAFAWPQRSIAEQWLLGALDHLHAVIFARGDDSGQRLYYYFCELQRRGVCRGPRPLLYDVAALPRQTSFEHTLESTRLLARELGSAAHRLDAALQRVRRREQLAQSVGARRLLPAPLRGSSAWAFEFAAGCDWRESFDAEVEPWLEQSSLLPMPRRVLLAGDPPPDDQLHLAIEAGGASVVLELTESTAAGERTQRDPFAAIAEEFQRRTPPVLAMRGDGRWLVDKAQECRADAVLLWLSEQDEALPWEIARQVRALREARIPTLLLARQPAHVSAASLTQVMHFLRDLREQT
ncbi:MAG TPA: 2-hydroxyacyl-CoA dehydratase family protein [Steroidobacteraceae bacterium]|nr:2-hydroxyacyl-CoA dehydratase family protein [Steroidobacteraceae bacterium]